MKNIFIAITLVAVTIGGALFYFQSNQNTVANQDTDVTEQASSSDAEETTDDRDLQIYVNEEYQFSITLPKNYVAEPARFDTVSVHHATRTKNKEPYALVELPDFVYHNPDANSIDDYGDSYYINQNFRVEVIENRKVQVDSHSALLQEINAGNYVDGEFTGSSLANITDQYRYVIEFPNRNFIIVRSSNKNFLEEVMAGFKFN